MSAPLFSLDGRLALVTGARRGIGLAITGALAWSGADVVGVSASLERDGGEARRRAEAVGRQFWAMPADLGDRAAVHGLLRRLDELDRPVDILVSNARIIHREPAAEHALEAWDDVIEVNLTASFILAQAIGAKMVARGSGKIVFTASLLSFQGGINVVGYTAAKHAIAGRGRVPRRSGLRLRQWHGSRRRWRVAREMSALDLIAACGVVPVVVIDDWEAAPALGDALMAAGLPVAEITLRTGAAVRAAELLARDPRFTVGAGTVLTPADVDLAVAAGAQFIVSPGFDAEVVPQLPHPGVVRPDGVAGDPQARVVGQHLLAAMAGDLLPGGQAADG